MRIRVMRVMRVVAVTMAVPVQSVMIKKWQTR